MNKVSPCSRDDCPPSHIVKDRTVNCGKCGALIHLMCIGISISAKEILVSRNVIVVCNACVIDFSVPVSSLEDVPTSPNVSLTSKSTAAPMASRHSKISSVSKSQTGQRSILDFARPTFSDEFKAEEIMTILSEIKSSVTEHRKETKSLAAILTENRQLPVNDSVNASRKPLDFHGDKLYSSVLANNVTVESNFPSLNSVKRKRQSSSSFTPKRIRRDPKVAAQKGLFVNRMLTSGTNAKSNHGLGSPVRARPNKSAFTKSVYVSKLKPDVTEEAIVSYLKSNIPDIKDDMFALRLLVKKDQKVDQLNFISFRLSCTDSLFNQLIDPSFWPSHVMIGEFVEKRKQIKFGDFLAKPPTPASIHSASPAPKVAASPAATQVTSPLALSMDVSDPAT